MSKVNVPELSGMPDDIEQNYCVIMDTYNEMGMHTERRATPFTDKATACKAYDEFKENQTPGHVAYLCKLLPLESIMHEWPTEKPKDDNVILPT